MFLIKKITNNLVQKHQKNVVTARKKTKMLRPRPRPVKQQQEYITGKKLFCCNMHVC